MMCYTVAMKMKASLQKRISSLRVSSVRSHIGAAGILYEGETACGYVIVAEQLFRGHLSRLLFVDGALQSAAVRERDKEHILLFPYMKGFDWAFRLHGDLQDALLIGGGGFVYPLHFLHVSPTASMDVVEMSPEIIGLSRRFFFLNKLEQNPRFRLFKTDGISFLLQSDRQYDLLINDAFVGKESDADLFRDDGIALAKAHLKEGGLYFCNIVTSLRGLLSRNGRRMIRHFSVHFRNVTILAADDTRNPCERQNCLLIASDQELGGL